LARRGGEIDKSNSGWNGAAIRMNDSDLRRNSISNGNASRKKGLGARKKKAVKQRGNTTRTVAARKMQFE
jgi:hypothetical protein